jgi:opacity protein-like surface antigen
MARFVTALSVLAAGLCITSPANAEAYDGPYIGLGLHFAWAPKFVDTQHADGSTGSSSATNHGVSFSGFLGYDRRLHNGHVIGLVGDYTLADAGARGPAFTQVATLRGRIGVLVDDTTLVYGTGGVAAIRGLAGHLGGFDYKLANWTPGWVVGAGVERRKMWHEHPIRIGVEALYYDFKSQRFSVPDRDAVLDARMFSVGVRLTFELDRSRGENTPMK